MKPPDQCTWSGPNAADTGERLWWMFNCATSCVKSTQPQSMLVQTAVMLRCRSSTVAHAGKGWSAANRAPTRNISARRSSGGRAATNSAARAWKNPRHCTEHCCRTRRAAMSGLEGKETIGEKAQARTSFGPGFDGRQQDELRVYLVHFLIHVVSTSVFGNSRSPAV